MTGSISCTLETAELCYAAAGDDTNLHVKLFTFGSDTVMTAPQQFLPLQRDGARGDFSDSLS